MKAFALVLIVAAAQTARVATCACIECPGPGQCAPAEPRGCCGEPEVPEPCDCDHIDASCDAAPVDAWSPEPPALESLAPPSAAEFRPHPNSPSPSPTPPRPPRRRAVLLI